MHTKTCKPETCTFLYVTLFLPKNSNKKKITIKLLPAGTLETSLVYLLYFVWQEVICFWRKYALWALQNSTERLQIHPQRTLNYPQEYSCKFSHTIQQFIAEHYLQPMWTHFFLTEFLSLTLVVKRGETVLFSSPPAFHPLISVLKGSQGVSLDTLPH